MPARLSCFPCTSAAWAFTSCTQIQSGLVCATQASTPLVAAERMPFRFRLVSLKKDFPMVAVTGQDRLAQDFVEFAVRSGVLRFGEFKTKAGRLSPYFFNAGLFDDGEKLGRLAQFYARRIQASGVQFDMLFGPAYKGIPLAAAVAIELARAGRNVPYAYNRKEAKDHGEGGTLVGAPVQGRVLIVDDVMSAGTAWLGASGQLERVTSPTAAFLLPRMARTFRAAMQLQPGIFKAYDIRGVVPSTLDEDLAEALGRVFGRMAREQGEPVVAVGR